MAAGSTLEASPNADGAPIAEASLVVAAQIQRQLEEATGDSSDVKELLKARVQHAARLLEESSAQLRKGLLQRIHDTLREISIAVESWETSKGFPFLRSANTESELRTHLATLQELIEEVMLRLRAVTSSPSSPSKPHSAMLSEAWFTEAESTPTAPAKSRSRCVLIVQKAPEKPGQLQQEWQQAAPCVSQPSGGHQLLKLGALGGDTQRRVVQPCAERSV